MKADSQAGGGVIRDGAIAGQVPSIPTFRPVASDVFMTRSERLVQLSVGHAMENYLRFCAALCEAQHEALHRILSDGTVAPWRTRFHDVLRALRDELLPTEARDAVTTLVSPPINYET